MLPRTAPNPDLLVTPAWVQDRLDDPGLRVVDATVWLRPRPVGPSTIDSGRPDFERAHVPGAIYLHMVDDLSDPAGAYAFMLRPPADLADHLGRRGLSADHTIVVYGDGTASATTRAWWVLRVAGARDVRIMDGGLARWRAEGRPVQSGPERPTPVDFGGTPRPELIATLDDVIAAVDDPAVGLVNALTPEQFLGTGGSHYGRPGRIPGSLSLPARDLIDAGSGCYLPADKLAEAVAASGIDDCDRVITYCGGGIAASTASFVLELLGYPAPALYDASLNEWSNRAELPMDLG